MTDEQYQTLLEQVNANTQAIEEIKEVLAQMNEASEAAATNETLIQALQEQVAQLTISVQTVANNTSTHESRITALEEAVPALKDELLGSVGEGDLNTYTITGAYADSDYLRAVTIPAVREELLRRINAIEEKSSGGTSVLGRNYTKVDDTKGGVTV